MSNGFVTMNGRIKRDGVCCKSGFGQWDFDNNRCPHDLDGFATIKITMNQWTHVVSQHDRFIAVRAVLKDGMVDTTGPGSGVICSPEQR